ncbi:adenosylhomocysteinase [Candidatus Woesebacteria bacterium RIFCSPLOWO2_01_FULL_39_21]|mgnify:CR=1 FL=1|uniref:Adenosylhomocysteinase n=1 Tax=Candidatus Woesebacteria bacterium RIFCSPLOWO2_01_FULL_39_21 TaxID=1802519 RepID=A0A1F8BFQ5_9BACT|nr:MAG: adenosylhomocysteinase [Candidatus Woesebacteria bacterium RIFCSPLOWO2_01_FULL_39_21]
MAKLDLDQYEIADLGLAKEGKLRIEWAARSMPVLQFVKERFKKEKPFRNIKIGACLHVTSETANLLITLAEGGAELALCACNPLSTQNDVAASLVSDYKISVFAVRGEDTKSYYRHIEKVLDIHPNITMDDGGDLVFYLHTKRKSQLKEIIGSNEETTTGVIRLRAMEKEGELKVPAVAVNYSLTKHMFDNRYGTGQSTIDGIVRSANVLLAGKTFVVAGYGWCGRGIAMRARGMGAKVMVTEVDVVKALEAVMDGFEVRRMNEAARVGDIFVTATGDIEVITLSHMRVMKDGAIVANSGHFNVEIEVDKLARVAKSRRMIRKNLEEFKFANGRRILLLAEGRLVNLVGAEGHPAEVMDMSFANQALAAEWLVKNRDKLEPKVYTLGSEFDEGIASLKLRAKGIRIDRLTQRQKKYLSSWQEGT